MTVKFAVELTSHLVHQHTGLDLSKRYYLDPVYRLGQDQQAAQWARTRYPAFEVVIESGEFSAGAPAVVRVGGLQPYLVVSSLFGAEIRFWGDHEPCTVHEPLREVKDLSSVQVPDIEAHPLIQKLLAQVQGMRQIYDGRLAINPPLFWDSSGWAFVHAPFTTAYKLRGESFFVELHTDPAGARHLIDIAAETTCRLIDLFAAAGERQVTGIHLGDCAASLVSAAHYRQFAVPALERMTARYGPGRLHSCGRSTHLLPAIQGIRGIQEYHLGWSTDLGAARKALGDLPIAYLVPPPFLLQEPKEIERQMRATLAANRGGDLLWWLMVDNGVPEEHVELAHQIWQEAMGNA
jgi:uroporphyrinogen-III decarboxylase